MKEATSVIISSPNLVFQHNALHSTSNKVKEGTQSKRTSKTKEKSGNWTKNFQRTNPSKQKTNLMHN
jgi:hypothetical protein